MISYVDYTTWQRTGFISRWPWLSFHWLHFQEASRRGGGGYEAKWHRIHTCNVLPSHPPAVITKQCVSCIWRDTCLTVTLMCSVSARRGRCSSGARWLTWRKVRVCVSVMGKGRWWSRLLTSPSPSFVDVCVYVLAGVECFVSCSNANFIMHWQRTIILVGLVVYCDILWYTGGILWCTVIYWGILEVYCGVL